MSVNIAEKIFYKFAGGHRYDKLAPLVGLDAAFYRRIAELLPHQSDGVTLDLGCGTGALLFTLAHLSDDRGCFIGIDQNPRQIIHARRKALADGMTVFLQQGTAESVPLADASCDLVCASMVFHEMPAGVRRRALAEVARILRPGGTFALIDWARPRFALRTALLLPWLLLAGEYTRDHWSARFPELGAACGLHLDRVVYLDPLIACRLFIRNTSK
jgi:ubiquinone/menaquinone biosynthesis C-methylase UbiE